MRLGHTVEERFGTNDMEILTTQFSTLCGNAGNLCLRIGNIIGDIHVSIGTHLQFAFLLQFMVGLGRFVIDYLSTSISDSGKAAAESEILPSEQIVFGILQCSGKFWYDFEYGSFTNVSVWLAVLVNVYLFIAVFLCVGCIDAGPLKCLGVEQHGMSTAGMHKQWLVCTDVVQIGLGDVFIILHPS